MKIGFNIKLGFIAGIVNCIAWYAVAKQLGFYSIEVYVIRNFITLGLLITGIIISIYMAKKNNNGFLEFKDALKTGMIYSLIIAFILSIFNYLYYTFITPDTIEYFLSEAKNAAIAHHLKETEIQKFLTEERSNFSSYKLMPPILFFGLIISLLAGAFFQKKEPHTFSAN
jgi:hypothetical protein